MEQSLRDDGFSVTADEDGDDALAFGSEECRVLVDGLGDQSP